MTQHLNSPCKHENPSLNLNTYFKKIGEDVCTPLTPILWGMEIGGVVWSAGFQPSFKLNETPCLKEIK